MSGGRIGNGESPFAKPIFNLSCIPLSSSRKSSSVEIRITEEKKTGLLNGLRTMEISVKRDLLAETFTPGILGLVRELKSPKDELPVWLKGRQLISLADFDPQKKMVTWRARFMEGSHFITYLNLPAELVGFKKLIETNCASNDYEKLAHNWIFLQATGKDMSLGFARGLFHISQIPPDYSDYFKRHHIQLFALDRARQDQLRNSTDSAALSLYAAVEQAGGLNSDISNIPLILTLSQGKIEYGGIEESSFGRGATLGVFLTDADGWVRLPDIGEGRFSMFPLEFSFSVPAASTLRTTLAEKLLIDCNPKHPFFQPGPFSFKGFVESVIDPGRDQTAPVSLDGKPTRVVEQPYKDFRRFSDS